MQKLEKAWDIGDLKAVKTGFRVSMEEGQRGKQRPYLVGPVDHAKGFGLHPVDIRDPEQPNNWLQAGEQRTGLI